MAAGLGSLIRTMVGIANGLTLSMQTPVLYQAVTLTSPGGPVAYNNEGEVSWQPAVPYTAIIQQKQVLKRKIDGTQQLSQFKMTLIVPGLVLNSLDRFTFNDTNKTPLPPILAIEATLDENQLPYSTEVFF